MVPKFTAATLEPYRSAGFKPVAKTCRPNLLPNLETRARLAAFAVHLDFGPVALLVRAPGPYWMPKCFPLWDIIMPNLRIVVEILALTLGQDTATMDLPFPNLAHRSLRETFICKSSSNKLMSMSVAEARIEATTLWGPTTCRATSSTYRHTVRYSGYAACIWSSGSSMMSNNATWAKPPPARADASVRVGSETAP